MGIPIITTDRLILPPLVAQDAVQIQLIFPQWDIVRYLTAAVPWPYPGDGARQFIEKVALPAMLAGKAWYWTLRQKSSPAQIIGVINLSDETDNHRGFWLSPAFQGRGFMFEACRAVTDFWFNTLQRPVLRVPKASANAASRRISTKSGMRLIKTEKKDYVCGTLDSELWELTREEWNRKYDK
ncbi:GNAT family N-acetyltransferase [Martelella alba]|uniref:GNAT family N-acetyltransferase n=1 Tax=Martelella alba TaxID=2590451 RepID=A0ABY2SJX9_9HYPH|nr:GNAT family N-acetyltransferase [Martelella alba]TKI05230.1 GNAT family N-acetyltransferase [Martelella alba]